MVESASRSKGRRPEVTAAAIQAFYEKGYEATSVRDIADLVGLLKGSIYYYMSSKEELLYEIIRAAHDRSVEILEAAMATPGDALQRLHAFVVAHFVHNAQHLSEMKIFLHDFRSLTAEHQEVIARERDRFMDYLSELLEEGQREGVVSSELNVHTTALVLLSAGNWMYQWYRPDGSRPPTDIARDIADVLVTGVATDGARDERLSRDRRYRTTAAPSRRQWTALWQLSALSEMTP